MSVELHCVFGGCGRPLSIDTKGWARHAEPIPDGIAHHVPHYDLPNGMRVIDLTEMDEREGDQK